MKRMKCYGRDKACKTETSTNRAFFFKETIDLASVGSNVNDDSNEKQNDFTHEPSTSDLFTSAIKQSSKTEHTYSHFGERRRGLERKCKIHTDQTGNKENSSMKKRKLLVRKCKQKTQGDAMIADRSPILSQFTSFEQHSFTVENINSNGKRGRERGSESTKPANVECLPSKDLIPRKVDETIIISDSSVEEDNNFSSKDNKVVSEIKSFEDSTPIYSSTPNTAYHRNKNVKMHLGMKKSGLTFRGNKLTSTPSIVSKRNKEKMYSPNLTGISLFNNCKVIINSSCVYTSHKRLRILSSVENQDDLQPLHTSSLVKHSNIDVNLPRELNFDRSLYMSLAEEHHISRQLSVGSDLLYSRSCTKYSKMEEEIPMNLSYSGRSYLSTDKELRSKAFSSSYNVHHPQSYLTNLIELSGQDTVICFENAYEWSKIKLKKVGEGSFGEVFWIKQNSMPSVLKIIPITENTSDHNIQSSEALFSEIKVLKCLSGLRNYKNNSTRNFNKLNGVTIVKGQYPEELLSAWDNFGTIRTAENERPDIFEGNQIFGILELEFGGEDLSHFSLKNAVEANSILKQIAISLAIAEETHLFEHRDLHLGNILVQRKKIKMLKYVLRGRPISIKSGGVIVSIIDFTFSRVLDAGCVFYNDLAQEVSLFEQEGDEQFEIYKKMRHQLKNEWQGSLLYSNVLWLTFLSKKMLEHKYLNPDSQTHKEYILNIKKFHKELKHCSSAEDCLRKCNIVKSLPKKDQSQNAKLNTIKFIGRKSFQKSSSVTKF